MNRSVATGFTLLEMLICVCILAIVSVVAVPLLSGNDPQKLNVAAQETSNLLRFALAEAKRTGGYILVDGKTVPGRLVLYYSNVNAQTPPTAGTSVVNDPLTKRATMLDVSTNPYSAGVALTANFWAGGQARPQLLIGPGLTQMRGFDGANNNFGALQAGSNVMLSFGTQSTTVSINSVTGLVTVP
jgi:prepilin-type N-terminal cleavage/methylation domain-containing protein